MSSPIFLHRSAAKFGSQQLTFRELETLTCFLATIFFTLFHTRIAGEEAIRSQGRTVLRSSLTEGAGDTMSDGTELTDDTATTDGDQDVETSDRISSFEWLHDHALETVATTDVVFHGAIVDFDYAGSWNQANPCGCAFSASGSIVLNNAGHSI